MNTLSLHTLRAAVAAFAITAAAPAFAQNVDPANESVRQEVVYGDDACSRPSTDDEIVVCVKLNESERFRIPEILRGDPNSPASQAWATKIESINQISRFGTDSCSPAGLGGFTGCTQKMIDAAVATRAQDKNVNWTAAIAAQRQDRIDAIDGNARRAEQAYQDQLANQDQREAEMAVARARLDAEENGETLAPLSPVDGSLAVPPGADESPEAGAPQ